MAGTPERDAKRTAPSSDTSKPGALGDAGQGPATDGTLASGYSSQSSSGGTGGDVLQQRGSGFSPGADSRVGAAPNDDDALAHAGVAAGAAGMGDDPPSARERKAGARAPTDDYDASEGSRAVGGVGGTSGGGGTTGSGRTTR